MAVILFDKEKDWKNFLPLTFTRPISELRVGILTIAEKWQKRLNQQVYYLSAEYLRKKFPFKLDPGQENLFINAIVLPDNDLVEAIKTLPLGYRLMKDDLLIAAKVKDLEQFRYVYDLPLTNYSLPVERIQYLWDIFMKNGKQIEIDFKLITEGRESQKLSPTNIVFQEERIFVEPGARVEAAILNPDGGYIYIGKDAEIMEGAVIRGSLALCEHSLIKLSAKIYGPTTIGPYSKVGGEVSRSVIIGYSNKAHDGFLGDAVVGQWCNFGADTNNSNLKNNYSTVKVWNYNEEKFVDSGLQFCGLFMGDHSKTGINTMLNTGTVVGVFANIFGAGYPRTFIPSFSWGGPQGWTEYKFDKALETAERVMKRRNKQLDDVEIEILKAVFEMTKKYRNF